MRAALGLWIGLQLDTLAHSPDATSTRGAAEDLLALMTPILKGLLHRHGVRGNQPRHAGLWRPRLYPRIRHGAVRPRRPHHPDLRGANGIQTLDLVGRKLPAHMGRSLRRFFHPVGEFLAANAKDAAMVEFIAPLAKAFGKLQQATVTVAAKGMANPDEAGAASSDYLRLFALVAMDICGHAWRRWRLAGWRGGGSCGQEFYEARLHTARFFMARMLPEAEMRFRQVMAGGKTLMDVPTGAFKI